MLPFADLISKSGIVLTRSRVKSFTSRTDHPSSPKFRYKTSVHDCFLPYPSQLNIQVRPTKDVVTQTPSKLVVNMDVCSQNVWNMKQSGSVQSAQTCQYYRFFPLCSSAPFYLIIITTNVKLKIITINLLKTKRILPYIRNQPVPRCKHFPPWL